MRSNVGRLKSLAQGLAEGLERPSWRCKESALNGMEGIENVKLSNFSYRRGHVQVIFEDMVLESGRIYAVTGGNGCGKSTFFGVLAACKSGTLPPGVELPHGLSLKGDDVVEITQQMYCPLYIEPRKWLQRLNNAADVQALLKSLDFGETDLSNLSNMETNWYSKLSGGQRSKVELISQVFLRRSCPDILLIDEALAPLDAKSKSLVHSKLKDWSLQCEKSLVLIIHHLDAHSQCVGGLFDDNLHFHQGSASLVGTCSERAKSGRADMLRPGGFFHDWSFWTLVIASWQHSVRGLHCPAAGLPQSGRHSIEKLGHELSGELSFKHLFLSILF